MPPDHSTTQPDDGEMPSDTETEPSEAGAAGVSSRTAAALNFFTSAAVLVLEILAGRMLAPYVGVSLETFTGIIGTVLAGIALGSAVGGRLADRHGATRLLGPTLVAGGTLACLSIPIVSTIGPSVDSSGASIVLLAFVGFFAPAAVLSAVGPMVAQLTLDDLSDTGSVVGSLSAAGTAGALFGTFITGFFLVSAAPTPVIVVAVGLALGLTGLVLWARLSVGGSFARRTGGPGATTALLLFGAAGVGSLALGPCQFETEYACVRVAEDPDRPSGRTLILDNTRNSYVDLDDPTHIEFRYLRLLSAAVDGLVAGGDVQAPLQVMHIGGGGFTYPGYLDHVRPGTQSVVYEIDAGLVEIGRAEMGLETSPDLQVVVGDARLLTADLWAAIERGDSPPLDLVVGDAFSGQTVPWHLTTREYLDLVARVLGDDGLYAMNLIDGNENGFGRAEARTLHEVFEHVVVLVPADDSLDRRPVNQVLLASNAPIGEFAFDPDDGRRLTDEEFEALIDGAQVLTDDFAPVDQLKSS